MNWKIPLFKMAWDETDVAAVNDVIRSGMSWAAGPAINDFEKKIAAYVGTKYAVTTNSGTSALHAVLAAYGVGPGDEVIVPSFTFIATANAALFLGAKPVFADIEEDTFGLDARDVERKITGRTRIILPIHYGGVPCRMDALMRVAKEHELPLIEDAAEALGATIGGKKVGSIGDSAILSFCQNKVITTGEGGAVVTNSPDVCQRLELIRSHGRSESNAYFTSTEPADYITLGYNFRMSTITAALGVAQIDRIAKIIAMRREKALYLASKLTGIKGLIIPGTPSDSFNVYQMFPVRVTDGAKKRDGLKDFLAKKGIMSRVYFDPVHLTLFYRRRFGYKGGELPVTEKIAGEVLNLPVYPDITHDEIDYIAASVVAFF
jgi:dTDP-4-amino-4,6-dideoxygalactose transaminase